MRALALVLCVLALMRPVRAQSDWASTRLIDGFDKTRYPGAYRYPEYTSGLHYSTDCTEGTASLSLTDAPQRSYVLCNYRLETRDWSGVDGGDPESLSVMIRTDADCRLKMSLWDLAVGVEDRLENQREWSAVFTAGPSTAWQAIVMPVRELAPGINFKRMKRWQLKVDFGGPSTGRSALVDDLRLVTSYRPPKDDAVFNATFVQVYNADDRGGRWDAARWAEEMRVMKGVGVSHVILQYSVHQISENETLRWQDTLASMLSAARQTGMKVVIGLYYGHDWSPHTVPAGTTVVAQKKKLLSALPARQGMVMREIWERSRAAYAEVIDGWYIPQEGDDFDWADPDLRRRQALYWEQVASDIKTATGKRAYVSAYAKNYQTAEVLSRWWAEVATLTPSVDTFLFQDSASSPRVGSGQDVARTLETVYHAVGPHRFGSVVEAFSEDATADSDAPRLKGLESLDRFRQQLRIAGKYGGMTAQFDWFWMRPGTSIFKQYQGHARSVLGSPR